MMPACAAARLVGGVHERCPPSGVWHGQVLFRHWNAASMVFSYATGYARLACLPMADRLVWYGVGACCSLDLSRYLVLYIAPSLELFISV